MSTSAAAEEAFGFLNDLTRFSYRGAGDTPTAARDRAAREAGITPAQAERVWKRWRGMTTVNGDVYRALRNKWEEKLGLMQARYEAACEANEAAAAAYRAERLELKAARNAVDEERAREGIREDRARP